MTEEERRTYQRKQLLLLSVAAGAFVVTVILFARLWFVTTDVEETLSREEWYDLKETEILYEQTGY